MGEVLRQLEQSQELREFLKSRLPKTLDGPGCAPSCSLILEDLEKNGKLTGWPKDSVGAGTYPVDGKLFHLILEFGDIPPDDHEDVDDLAAMVLHLMETQDLRKD